MRGQNGGCIYVCMYYVSAVSCCFLQYIFIYLFTGKNDSIA